MPFATRTRPRKGFKIRYAVMALAAAIVFGTIGFHFVEGWSLADSLYVTVQTLTTVGYGDITPVHPLARAVAVLEALTGQLYLTILLARLVSLELRSRRDG